MKREYFSPTLIVVHVRTTTMVCASGEILYIGDDYSEEDTELLSRGYKSVWDDDDE